jgi:tRNA threonylcarbamoyladenosine biosynthesis protein TsaE
METFSIMLNIKGLDSTSALGSAIAAAVPPRTTLAMVGTLGAGKTYLAQAIAVACGVPSSAATSPTFVLCQVYNAKRTIYHLDAYRIADDDEFIELGVEEMFASNSLTLVEWADRVESVLPRDRITIEMEIDGPHSRRVTITAPVDQKPTLLAIQADWQSAFSP